MTGSDKGVSQQPVQLKVLEAYTRDVGRAAARLDYAAMDALGALGPAAILAYLICAVLAAFFFVATFFLAGAFFFLAGIGNPPFQSAEAVCEQFVNNFTFIE